MILSILEFFGHFHPMLVHLPIGILLVGLLLQWLSSKQRYKSLQPAVSIVLMFGIITALISCITGYLLSISDDYGKTLISWHMWMGISVLITTIMLYAKEKTPGPPVNKKILSVGLLILIMITGHLGGSLTHGSDYLTKPLKNIFRNDSSSNTAIKPIANVQEALVYNDVIQPILNTKCYACHGPNKQKGGLRMDDSLKLIKGGKNGIVIEPNNADSSEMIKRLLLAMDNEDHMPPKEKPQPSESQIAILHWWIETGADFAQKVKNLNQPDKIKPILLALQQATDIKKKSTDIPATMVKKADNNIIDQLIQEDVLVSPVAQNNNYLMANFVTDTFISKVDMQLLLALKKQLIWLKLGFTNISDSNLETISKLNNLTRLSLEHTNISDKGLALLRSLQNLQYLNLVGTKVTAQGVLQLKKLKALQSMYLYQTNIGKADWGILNNAFPKVQIDSGGYSVPLLATDTTVVKTP